MSTTIQVSNSTKQKLENIKNMKNANSYEEVIEILIDESVGSPRSMFGKVKLSSWSKKNRMKLNEY